MIFRTVSLFALLFFLGDLSSQADSLVAVFNFDGNAIDSITGREGTVDGPLLVTDRFGNENGAYEFDGVDDIIRVSDDSLLRLEGDFTLAVWFMPYSVKDGTLFRKNSSQNQRPSVAYSLGVSATGNHTYTVSTDVSADGLSSQGPLINEYVLDEWNLIVASKKSDTIRLVTNVFGRGRFTFYEKQIEGIIGYDGSPLIIGTRSQLPANTFHGRIDEIRIYNEYVSVEDLLNVNFSDETTNVIDIDESSVYSIYPNPFTDQIIIEAKNPEAKNGLVSLYDVTGKLVHRETLSDGFMKPSLSHEGLYYLQIETEEGTFIKKMIRANNQ